MEQINPFIQACKRQNQNLDLDSLIQVLLVVSIIILINLLLDLLTRKLHAMRTRNLSLY
jgi:hypothetical protein